MIEPSSSTAYQTGATCGRPSARTVASFPVCGGSVVRNARTSSSVIRWYGTPTGGSVVLPDDRERAPGDLGGHCLDDPVVHHRQLLGSEVGKRLAVGSRAAV